MARILNPPEDIFDLPLEMRPLRLQYNAIEREREKFRAMVLDYDERGYSLRDIAEGAGLTSHAPIQRIVGKKT